ncbi:DUF4340 domain-containing protein [Leucothrix mucor]|uniref:DUF4340 domain-containing protein n=1 Tax=Leucothrix mucor TaxID=45248 RepID=UPI0003B3EBB4|nr:DUF4340 domain-containing protein [Leucothrix mucor]
MQRSSSSKRRMINLFLLILLAGLGYLAYQQVQIENKGAETLYDPAIGESVDEVTILLPGQPAIRFESGQPDWQIVSPIEAKADSRYLQQLFTLLSESVLAEYVAADQDLAAFDLTDKAIRVRFNQVEYALGSLNPVNHRRYVLLNQRILLVNEAVYELLSRGVDGFRETP